MVRRVSRWTSFTREPRCKRGPLGTSSADARRHAVSRFRRSKILSRSKSTTSILLRPSTLSSPRPIASVFSNNCHSFFSFSSSHKSSRDRPLSIDSSSPSHCVALVFVALAVRRFWGADGSAWATTTHSSLISSVASQPSPVEGESNVAGSCGWTR